MTALHACQSFGKRYFSNTKGEWEPLGSGTIIFRTGKHLLELIVVLVFCWILFFSFPVFETGFHVVEDSLDHSL